VSDQSEHAAGGKPVTDSKSADGAPTEETRVVDSPAPAAATPPPTPPLPPPPAAAPIGASSVPSDRPEVAVGAAFAGGLVLALVLKRLAR
jgi:hypothetical protein